jgi:hypothetical protein
LALTTRTLPSLMNGISRQPAILRSPDQTEDELNTWGEIASGLTRRPPTTTVAKLDGLDLSNAQVHHINRDLNERYLVIIKNGGIEVYDEATGEEKTVAAPEGWAYLDAPGTAYRAMTVADYTFIVNTEKTVALLAAGQDEVAPSGNYRFPGGTNPRGLTAVLAEWVNGQNGQYAPNYNDHGGSVTATVKSAEDLPSTVCSGCVYRVLGAAETSFVSYYVRGDGTVWNETVKPGLKNRFDENTMPHVLIRLSDGTFEFVPFSWKARRVGDYESNPAPPFVGRTIRDVFFYQNRLGFVSDESIIFSAAGDYGDFWRRTVLDYIDSDALAAAATTTDVAILDYAVPFADGVMLFSGQRQLSLTNGDSGLSAHSLAIQPVTRYVMAPGVRPAPLGSQVHFVTDSGGYSAVQEYTRLAGADPTEAADITAHVPGLIPSGASQIIPVPDLDALFVLTRSADDGERNRLFAYQFFWDGEKKVISAWRVWDFDDAEPVSGAYLSGALHLLMERPDGYFLEKIDLSPNAVTEGMDHVIHLDRGEIVTGVYDGVADTTEFTVSFAPDADKVRVVRQDESEISPTLYTIVGTTITVPGDESAAPVVIGDVYETLIAFTRQYPVDWQGRPLSTGRLTLHTWSVNVQDTAYTRARVYPYGKAVAEHDPDMVHETLFTGKVLGDVSLVIGQKTYGNTTFTFSVAGNAAEARVELINDTPYASTWTSGEWEGLFFSRAL